MIMQLPMAISPRSKVQAAIERDYERVTGTATVKRIWSWRTMTHCWVLAIDIGRPDPVDPTGDWLPDMPQAATHQKTYGGQATHASVVLDFVKDNPGLTSPVISQQTGINRNTVRSSLRRLTDAHLVISSGDDVRWFAKDQS